MFFLNFSSQITCTFLHFYKLLYTKLYLNFMICIEPMNHYSILVSCCSTTVHQQYVSKHWQSMCHQRAVILLLISQLEGRKCFI